MLMKKVWYGKYLVMAKNLWWKFNDTQVFWWKKKCDEKLLWEKNSYKKLWEKNVGMLKNYGCRQKKNNAKKLVMHMFPLIVFPKKKSYGLLASTRVRRSIEKIPAFIVTLIC